MLRLSAKVTIRSEKTWVFDKITSCEIDYDIENITQTCTLVLPNKLKWLSEQKIPIKRGDQILIEFGYDDNLERVFSGYIKTITEKTPIEILCEDKMYSLKKVAAKKKSYANATIEQILIDNIPSDISYKTFAKQTIGKYTVSCDTVAQLLGDLTESGIITFFKGDVLYCGMLHQHDEIGGKKQVFKTGDNGNIIDDSDLVYTDKDDINLRIKATGTDSKGKKIKVEVGDKDGEVRSFFKYNTTKETLKAEAEKKLTEWKVGGLSGSFTTFGGDICGLLDIIRVYTSTGQKGDYKIIKNTINYSNAGYRQNIKIGGKSE